MRAAQTNKKSADWFVDGTCALLAVGGLNQLFRVNQGRGSSLCTLSFRPPSEYQNTRATPTFQIHPQAPPPPRPHRASCLTSFAGRGGRRCAACGHRRRRPGRVGEPRVTLFASHVSPSRLKRRLLRESRPRPSPVIRFADRDLLDGRTGNPLVILEGRKGNPFKYITRKEGKSNPV